MKIAEVSLSPFILRRDFWQKELKLNIEFEDIGVDHLTDFLKKIEHGEADSAALLLNSKDVVKKNLLNKFPLPQNVLDSFHCDAIVYMQGGWWFESLFSLALEDLIKMRAPTLNTNHIAYVTGFSLYTYAEIIVLIKLGYKKITFIGKEKEKSIELKAHFKQKYFGVDIETINEKELTFLPNNGSILINNFSVVSDKTTIDDLSYLNFLLKEALIVDVTQNSSESTLLESAVSMDKKVISFRDLTGLADFMLLKKLGFDVHRSAYLGAWSKIS